MHSVHNCKSICFYYKLNKNKNIGKEKKTTKYYKNETKHKANNFAGWTWRIPTINN